MGDASLSIQTSFAGVKSFEANSKPLETKTAGINFSKANDFSVPFKVSDDVKVYLRQDQVDALRMAATGASRNEAIDGDSKVTVTVGGKDYKVSAQEIHSQLQGKGSLT